MGVGRATAKEERNPNEHGRHSGTRQEADQVAIRERRSWHQYRTFKECTIQNGERYERFIIRYRKAWEDLQREDESIAIEDNLIIGKMQEAAKLDDDMKEEISARAAREGEDTLGGMT